MNDGYENAFRHLLVIIRQGRKDNDRIACKGMHAILSPPGGSAGDWGNNAERKALVLLCEARGIPETAVQFMSFQEWHTNIAVCSESNVSILRIG